MAIDTATGSLSLALYDGQRVVSEESHPAQMRHTVALAPAVEQLLRRAEVSPGEIRAVGVAQGPGSYTALRIGMAFALGFAIPRNLPVYGIPTFEILVRAQPATEKELVAVIAAGRGRIAWCGYRASAGKWKAAGQPCVGSWEALAAEAPKRARICGDVDRAGRAALAKRRDLKIAPAHRNLRRAGVLAEITAEHRRDPETRPMMLQPIYLDAGNAGKGEGC
ncbi:MAG: tRNA (adenosine(37)-N6)-threonylcarbamoyltransferase complex dimerization subunit type 1 TsaB [Anaerolineales bacterium]|nr:tRNA (adenosine(37)-N6)-threonylcarbamoyltransferase complex dimerization subunit type 1 TsaB [Anaerolineales bacterium]